MCQVSTPNLGLKGRQQTFNGPLVRQVILQQVLTLSTLEQPILRKSAIVSSPKKDENDVLTPTLDRQLYSAT